MVSLGVARAAWLTEENQDTFHVCKRDEEGGQSVRGNDEHCLDGSKGTHA